MWQGSSTAVTVDERLSALAGKSPGQGLYDGNPGACAVPTIIRNLTDGRKPAQVRVHELPCEPHARQYVNLLI